FCYSSETIVFSFIVSRLHPTPPEATRFPYTTLFRSLERRFTRDLGPTWEQMKPFFVTQIDEIRKKSPELAQTFQYLVNTKNSFPTSNNRVELLINGEEKFPKLIEDIRRAQHHIHLEYYIVDEDDF